MSISTLKMIKTNKFFIFYTVFLFACSPASKFIPIRPIKNDYYCISSFKRMNSIILNDTIIDMKKYSKFYFGDNEHDTWDGYVRYDSLNNTLYYLDRFADSLPEQWNASSEQVFLTTKIDSTSVIYSAGYLDAYTTKVDSILKGESDVWIYSTVHLKERRTSFGCDFRFIIYSTKYGIIGFEDSVGNKYVKNNIPFITW